MTRHKVHDDWILLSLQPNVTAATEASPLLHLLPLAAGCYLDLAALKWAIHRLPVYLRHSLVRCLRVGVRHKGKPAAHVGQLVTDHLWHYCDQHAHATADMSYQTTTLQQMAQRFYTSEHRKPHHTPTPTPKQRVQHTHIIWPPPHTCTALSGPKYPNSSCSARSSTCGARLPTYSVVMSSGWAACGDDGMGSDGGEVEACGAVGAPGCGAVGAPGCGTTTAFGAALGGGGGSTAVGEGASFGAFGGTSAAACAFGGASGAACAPGGVPGCPPPGGCICACIIAMCWCCMYCACMAINCRCICDKAHVSLTAVSALHDHAHHHGCAHQICMYTLKLNTNLCLLSGWVHASWDGHGHRGIHPRVHVWRHAHRARWIGHARPPAPRTALAAATSRRALVVVRHHGRHRPLSTRRCDAFIGAEHVQGWLARVPSTSGVRCRRHVPAKANTCGYGCCGCEWQRTM